MRIHGVEFKPVWDASGVRGFFGEGYPYHRFLRPLGLDFTGSTFVAKTTTLLPRIGNMTLRADGITPRELFPDCVRIRFFKGVALNAVGLSGPGAASLIGTGRWNTRTESFQISFMSVNTDAVARFDEWRTFLLLIKEYSRLWRAQFGIQKNYSCPNVGLHLGGLISKMNADAELIGQILDVPYFIKINILMPVAAVADVLRHPAIDGIVITNTLPWGVLPDQIDWHGLFGTDESPLTHLGGGGLSGKPLLSLLQRWLISAREVGIQKHINAGGGILSPQDCASLQYADSFALGSIAMLRGWRVRATIKEAYRLKGVPWKQ